MHVRKTLPQDIEAIGEIYRQAKQFMRDNGNSTQWTEDYPSEKTALSDMQNGIGYVCEVCGEVVCVFAFAVDREPTYDKIYDGEWVSDEKYAYIHRIAVKKHGRGIVDFCFNECFKMHPNLKIDTHRDNIPMQKVLVRSGFQRCGVIYLEDGEERIAFQKIK